MLCRTAPPRGAPPRRAPLPLRAPRALRRLAAAAALACGSAGAQQAPLRDFPAEALRGRLEVVQPPDALLDGRPVRLAPGARIRGTANLLVTPASLAGERRVVNYLRDGAGDIQQVWLLTEAEAAQPRASAPGGGILSWFGF